MSIEPPPAESGPVSPEAAPTNGADEYQAFMFERDLAQIYLLLDHISTSTSKELPKSASDDRATSGVDQAQSESDFVKKIAMISYPPPKSDVLRADEVSTLVRSLDVLNRAARPANCLTIAFTLLVAGEGRSDNVQRAAGGTTPAGPRSLTRYQLAMRAFPSLENAAKDFRRFSTSLIYGMFIFFSITCLLSWNVATGNALLGQTTALQSAKNDIAKQIADAESADSSKASGSTPPGGTTAATPVSVAPDVPGSFIAYCDRFRPDKRTSKQVEQTDSVTGTPLCDRRETLNLRLVSAQTNLETWVTASVWRIAFPVQDIGKTPCSIAQTRVATAPVNGCDRANLKSEIDAQWAAALLQVLGGAVLPICYGLLGAGAAVVRSVSAKIKESLLAPRDLKLSFVQLVLGAVIGGCIGLFITPAGTGPTGEPSLFGSVQLSASALCFVAGFGVEAVFAALETIIRRVFNVEDPTRKANA
jgi:hypothetical protein